MFRTFMEVFDMALVRWDPSRELDTLQGEMNRLFSSFFETPSTRGGTGNGSGASRRWIPAMDLVETQDDFVLRADLPGIGEKDVSIELENNVLTVSGERKAEQEERHEGYYRIERATGSFARSLSLPEGIDAASVSATFDNGVLTVRIPKPVQAKPKRVRIGVNDAGGEVVDAGIAAADEASAA
jgi:HSP20 family protein